VTSWDSFGGQTEAADEQDGVAQGEGRRKERERERERERKEGGEGAAVHVRKSLCLVHIWGLPALDFE